jgi:hypothetical protein
MVNAGLTPPEAQVALSFAAVSLVPLLVRFPSSGRSAATFSPWRKDALFHRRRTRAYEASKGPPNVNRNDVGIYILSFFLLAVFSMMKL